MKNINAQCRSFVKLIINRVTQLLLLLLFVAHTSLFAAENLNSTLQTHKWDRLIGTWVDASTQGTFLKTTYAWKFKDTVIENTVIDGQGKRTHGIIGRNPKTGAIFTMSVNSSGGSSIGTITLGEKQAVYDVGFVTEQGHEGKLKLLLEFEDDDTLNIIIDAPEPVTIKMHRLVAPDLLGGDKPTENPDF